MLSAPLVSGFVIAARSRAVTLSPVQSYGATSILKTGAETSQRTLTAPWRSVRLRHSHREFTEARHVSVHDIPRMYGTDASRRTGHDHVSRLQRVHRRRILNQPLNIEDEVPGIRFLPCFAVDRD